METDEEDQSNELLALPEICAKGEFEVCKSLELKHLVESQLENPETLHAGRLTIAPNLEESGISVHYQGGEIKLKHLPPIILEFVLPKNYPSSNPPKYSLKAVWLNQSQLSSLRDKLDSLWQENEGFVILFTWISFLKEEALTDLNISVVLDVEKIIKNFQLKDDDGAGALISEFDSLLLNSSQTDSSIFSDTSINSKDNCIANGVCDKETNCHPQPKETNHLSEDLKELPKLQKSRHNKDHHELNRRQRKKSEPSATTNASQGPGNTSSSRGRAKPKSKATKRRVDLVQAEGQYDNPNISDITYEGVVCSWVEFRGFGFVHEKESRHEYYFHRSSFVGSKKLIHKGMRVTFKLGYPGNGKNRLEAQDVRKLVNLIQQEAETGEHRIDADQVTQASKDDPAESDKNEPDEASVCLNVAVQVPSEKSEALPEVMPKARSEARPVPRLIKYLKEYSAEAEMRLFDQSVFRCNVCFAEKLGSLSISFAECNHVYCKDCMSTYFSVQISDGQMSNLTCPEDKCTSQALPTQVKGLVSDSDYQKYERQLLETTLETMSDILLCPRVTCQCPTVIDRDGSMGECPKCKFAFCIYCKAAYHGVAPCRIKSKEHKALITEYMGANDERKSHLEKIYGKKQLTSMMNMMLSENYMTDNTKPCPRCNAPIQKSEGCNKMTCNKCNTYFCYLCGSKLPMENPYSHFSILGGNCFNQLFQGADNDENEFIFLNDDFDDFDDEDEDGLINFVL